MNFSVIECDVVFTGKFPAYKTKETINVFAEGTSLEEAAIELLSEKFEFFSDVEVLSGVSVEVFVSDGQKVECYFLSTDGHIDDKEVFGDGMEKHLTDTDCLISFLLNRAIGSDCECLAGQWHIDDQDSFYEEIRRLNLSPIPA